MINRLIPYRRSFLTPVRSFVANRNRLEVEQFETVFETARPAHS